MMSVKRFIVTVSLAGSAAGLACWLLADGPAAADAPEKRSATSAAQAKSSAKVPRRQNSPRPSLDPASPPRESAAAMAPRRPAPARMLTTAELTARAAKVEQEANHELRRLVELLDLDEAQQEKVFQTLARHSKSWVPGMQFAPAAGIPAEAAGKRGDQTAAGGGLYSAVPVTPVPAPQKGDNTVPETAPQETPLPDSNYEPEDTDPTDEILALLGPEQQDKLVQAEIDRAAWWAEILEQIAPPDDVPGIDGVTPEPAAGDTKDYEGSDVLE